MTTVAFVKSLFPTGRRVLEGAGILTSCWEAPRAGLEENSLLHHYEGSDHGYIALRADSSVLASHKYVDAS